MRGCYYPSGLCNYPNHCRYQQGCYNHAGHTHSNSGHRRLASPAVSCINCAILPFSNHNAATYGLCFYPTECLRAGHCHYPLGPCNHNVFCAGHLHHHMFGNHGSGRSAAFGSCSCAILAPKNSGATAYGVCIHPVGCSRACHYPLGPCNHNSFCAGHLHHHMRTTPAFNSNDGGMSPGWAFGWQHPAGPCNNIGHHHYNLNGGCNLF